MTLIEFGSSLLLTAVCLAAFGLAIRANRNRPAFYRVFLLLFFTVWAVIVWLRPPLSPGARLVPSSALLLGAFGVGFIRLPPPKSRRETKNLLDLMETDRTLDRFFQSPAGRLFWPLLSVLIFSVLIRTGIIA